MRYLSNTGPIFPPKKTHDSGRKSKTKHAGKFDMESKNGGLADDVPFQLGDFQVAAVKFQGCK